MSAQGEAGLLGPLVLPSGLIKKDFLEEGEPWLGQEKEICRV